MKSTLLELVKAVRNLLYRVILTAYILAAGMICQAQVYSINGISPNSFLPATHRPDEIKIWGCSYDMGTNASMAEWDVSTNALAKQPHWDGVTAEVPLSARKACALALSSVRKRFPHVESWLVESVLLRRPGLDEIDVYPDVWWYEITFRPRGADDRAEEEYQAGYCAATQIVLLDGTVVPQTVLKKKQAKFQIL